MSLRLCICIFAKWRFSNACSHNQALDLYLLLVDAILLLNCSLLRRILGVLKDDVARLRLEVDLLGFGGQRWQELDD